MASRRPSRVTGPGLTSPLEITAGVPTQLANWHRTEGWWDSRGLADGIDAAASGRPGPLALADYHRRLR